MIQSGSNILMQGDPIMSAGKQYDGWIIVTGQDFRQKLVVRDASQPKISNPDSSCSNPSAPTRIFPPKDLTGWTAKMDIRATAAVSGTLIKSLVSGSGITLGTPDPADGTVELFIDSTETKAAPFTNYKGARVFYD